MTFEKYLRSVSIAASQMPDSIDSHKDMIPTVAV